MANEATPIENDLYLIIEPIVEKFDVQVKSLRLAQVELREKIDDVSAELQRISEAQPISVDLTPHIRRLTNAKRRLVLASNIIQNAQERLSRLHRSIEAESLRKQAMVEAQRALIDVSKQSN